jgi:hypothetical protein
MPRIVERWLLFKYIDGELTPLSKPPQEEGTSGEGAAEVSRT